MRKVSKTFYSNSSVKSGMAHVERLCVILAVSLIKLEQFVMSVSKQRLIIEFESPTFLSFASNFHSYTW